MALDPDYEIVEVSHRSHHVTVCRGRRRADAQAITIKLYPASEDGAFHAQRAFEIGSLLAHVAGVVRVHGRPRRGADDVALVMDEPGVPLGTVIRDRRLDLTEAIELARRIASVLAGVHAAGVVHNDLNPWSIVVDRTSLVAALTDFELAFSLVNSGPQRVSKNLVLGSLAYVAPEQTGRVDWPVDQRADLYALGVILYELIEGRTPFESTDPLETVHGHLAKMPPPLSSAVPRSIARLVLKLLAKDPEQRYQSASGLSADLEVCVEHLRSQGAVPDFELARHDAGSALPPPRTLYGRADDIDALWSRFSQIAAGSAQMALVGGPGGIGKSALVNEVRRRAQLHGAYVAAGKFERLKQDVPYSGLWSAFRQLGARLLTESSERAHGLRERLRALLRDDIALILTVVPELALLLALPETASVSEADVLSPQRVPDAIARFVASIAAPEHPLVLIVDDLQWADAASLMLLESMLSSSGARGLYVLGTYRDAELTREHPLWTFQAALGAKGVPCVNLLLTPLDAAGVTALLAEALQSSPEAVAPLSRLVLEKTLGNPFFIHAFLRSLHDADLLHFDPTTRSWAWDPVAIVLCEVTENVADLLAAKFLGMEQSSQQLLSIMALLGAEVRSDVLAISAGLELEQVTNEMIAAVDVGLVTCVEDGESGALIYRFAHDQIQQAVHSKLSEDDLGRLHQGIGRRLLESLPGERLMEQLFELLHHLNYEIGASPPHDARLVELNLAAARRAMAAAAYQTVLHHCDIGLRYLGANPFERDYASSRAFHTKGALAACVLGELERGEAWSRALQKHGRSPLDRAPAYEVQVRTCWAQNRPNDAVDALIEGLANLGLPVPRQPSRRAMVQELLWTAMRVRRRSLSEITSLPMMSDPQLLAAMRLFELCETPLLHISQTLLAVLACRLVNMTLDHGLAPGTPGAFVALAMVLCSPYGMRDFGNEVGDIAEALARKLQTPGRGKTLTMLQYGVRHWRRPLRETLPCLLDAAAAATESSDLEYATIAPCFYGLHSMYAGVELSSLARECDEFALTIKRAGQLPALGFMSRVRQCILNLQGNSKTPWLLVGDALDETVMLARFARAGAWMQYAAFMVEKIVLANIFAQESAGLSALTLVKPHEHHLAGLFRVTMYHFHGALLRLLAASHRQGKSRRELLREARSSLTKLQAWAKDASANYQHCAALVEAELAHVSGDTGTAARTYEVAIRLAHQHGFVNDEALAHERAGRFHLSFAGTTAGHAHLREAHRAYSAWGAYAKAHALEAEYPNLIRGSERLVKAIAGVTAPPVDRSSAPERELNLDIRSALKASQALSSELVLPRLIARLLRIASENAGAERGALILLRDDQLIVQAIHGSEHTGLSIPPTEPRLLDTSNVLPGSIIRYVARVQVPLVLADASSDARFSGDSYLQRTSARSVLAIPIVHQGALSGVLYLENNQSSGAFTHERVEVLGLLTSQAAISIDNANLYARLSTTSNSLRESTVYLERALLALDTQLTRMNALNDFSLRAGAAQDPISVCDIALAKLHETMDSSLLVFLGQEGSELVPHFGSNVRAEVEVRWQLRTLPIDPALGLSKPELDVVSIAEAEESLHPWTRMLLHHATDSDSAKVAGASSFTVVPAFRRNGDLVGVFIALSRPLLESGDDTETGHATDVAFLRLFKSHIETALENVFVQRELRRQIMMRSEGLAEALARLSGSAENTQRDLMDGEVLNERYLVSGVLGRGAMGVVYDVHRISDGQRLALKLLTKPDAAQLARFAREAQIISRLSHPNVVAVVDVDVASVGFFYLAMEYVSGRALDAHRSRFGSRAWALSVLRQVAEGLSAVHARGIVHRDLKPANILISEVGGELSVKIADFGISKLGHQASFFRRSTAELGGSQSAPRRPSATMVPDGDERASSSLTEAGMLIGTPRYMAPEAAFEPEGSAATDVFSFGLMAYELLSGRYAFADLPVEMAIRNERLPAPQALDGQPGAASDLDSLLAACLRERPAERPTARTIADQLAQIRDFAEPRAGLLRGALDGTEPALTVRDRVESHMLHEPALTRKDR